VSGDILKRNIRGADGEMFGQKISVYDVGIARFLCDRGHGREEKCREN